MEQIDTRFFRAGVGTVIYNQKGEVALFQRAQFPVGVWQFQQGGIDLGETIEATLWRELREEVGLKETDFAQITLFPEWTIHQYALADNNATKSRLGQAHRWFFLELRSDVTIDLSRASEYEASDWRWATFSEAIAETEPVKKPVYETLAAFFEQSITIPA